MAEKYNKKDINILIGLSAAYKEIDVNTLAVKYLNKAKKIDKANYKVLYLESKLMQDSGSQKLKSSICQNLFYPEGWIDLAENALVLRDIISAEEYINIASLSSKNNPRYYYYKSIVSSENKDYDAAEMNIIQAKNIMLKLEKEKNKVTEL